MTTQLTVLENEAQTMANYLTKGYWTARRWATDVITFNVADLTPDEQLIARAAFSLWEDFADINFVESINTSNINLTSRGNTENDDRPTAVDDMNDGFITNVDIDIPGNLYLGVPNNLNINDYFFQTYVHEIGHALGIGHPGPYNGEAIYGQDNVFIKDSWNFSVMSYISQDESGFASYAFVIGPQIIDIIAIQQIYGANTTTRQNSSVYDWQGYQGFLAEFPLLSVSASVADGRAVAPSYTIYDTGGYDALLGKPDQLTSQVIDLRPGKWSSIGGAENNIVIHFGSVIEEARGGGGDDTISGNDVDNSLFGMRGIDVIFGFEGNDALDGGAGDDILDGGFGNDIIRWDADNDTLSGGGGNDTFQFAKGLGLGRTVTDGGPGTDVAYFDGLSAEYIIEFINQDQLRDGATRDVLIRHADAPHTTFHELTSVEKAVFGDLAIDLRYSSVLGYALDAGTLYKIGYDLQRTAVPGFQMDNSWGNAFTSLATISVDGNGIVHASGGQFDFRASGGSQSLGGFHAAFDPASGSFTQKAQALDMIQFSKASTAASAIADNGNFYVMYNDVGAVSRPSLKSNIIVSYDNSFSDQREYLAGVFGLSGALENERYVDRINWTDAADFGPDGYLYTLTNLQGYTATGFYIRKYTADLADYPYMKEEASYFLDVGNADNQLQDIAFTADGVLIGIDRYRDLVRIDLDSGQLETLGRLAGFAPSTSYTSNGQAWWPTRSFDFDIVGTYSDLLEALGRAENYRPFADADGSYQVQQGQRLHVSASDGVLVGDVDADGDALTAQLVSGPQNGTLSFLPDGSFSYAPKPRFSGTDSFTYQASDNELTSNLVTVWLDVVPSATLRPQSADFNGDGTSDILLQSGGTVVEWFLKDGAYQGGRTLTTTATGFDVKGSGDFNGDGVGDLVLQQGGTVLTWLINPDGSYRSGNTITTAVTGFEVVGTGDFNGDGTSDILLQSGGTVVNWLMDQQGLYASGNTITTSATGFEVKAVGDFNGDGIDDIMLQNGGTVVDWLMNAAGQYQSGNTLTTGAGPYEVKGAGDFDGDGIDDVVLQSGGTVVDWLLNGSGGYSRGNTITTGATGFDVVATGDYNGDGTDDIMLYDGSFVVQWTLQNGGYLSGSTLSTGLNGFDFL